MRHSALLALLSPLLLTGCGINDTPTAAPAPAVNQRTPLGTIQGTVHGGRQPIIGAHIFVFAAGTSGYGGNGIAASASNASTSLLNSYTTGSFPTTQDKTPGSPTLNDYYVTTDASGSFSLTGEYTCTPGTQVYLYALGGQPTTGATNNSSSLMAVLGQCPSTQTMAALVPSVNMNEVSTVAAAFALAGFASDAIHISSSGTTLAQTGIANAAANAAQLYDISGAHGSNALATTPGRNGTVPQSTIDAIADSLAACINSSGSTSTQCTTLFKDATSDGITCTTPPCADQPTDTSTAAINIAHYPGTNVSTIFGLAAAIGTPFLPTLAAAPNDFTIGIKFTAGSLNAPLAVAVDISGNIWTLNASAYYTVTELSSSGSVLSGSSGFRGTYYPDYGTLYSEFIALDASSNAYVSSYQIYQQYVCTEFGCYYQPQTGYPSILKITSTGAGSPLTAAQNSSYFPGGLALDGNANLWVSNGYQIIGETSTTASSPTTSVYISIPAGLANQTTIAMDGAGSAWVPLQGQSALAKLSSSGTLLSPSNTSSSIYGYTGGGLTGARAAAVDSSGHVWLANSNSSLSKFDNSGNALSGSAGYSGGGLATPAAYGLAIDGAGSAWIVNTNNSLSRFSSAGTAITPSTGYTAASMSTPTALALDGSGNIWITNSGNSTLTEIIGAAAPVITPLCAGLPSTPTSDGSSNLGTRP